MTRPKISHEWIVFSCAVVTVAFAAYFFISLFGLISFWGELPAFYYMTSALLLASSVLMLCGALIVKGSASRWRFKLSLLVAVVAVLVSAHYLYYQVEVNFMGFLPALALLVVLANFFVKAELTESG